MSLHNRYPAASDLRRAAKRRLPHFVWEFLDSGTGDETGKSRNRAALDKVLFRPDILRGDVTTDLRCSLLGQQFDLPFGIAPVGMSGLIWPDAERLLATTAARANIPYTLSTVASQTPEMVQPVLGDHGWFQLYPPKDKDIRRDMLRRARDAGFETLVLTVDVGVASRRERQVRSGLTTPPRLTPRLLSHIAQAPAWAWAYLGHPMPRMRMIDDYAGAVSGAASNAHAGYQMRAAPDWDYLREVRGEWHGPMVIKGIMSPEHIPALEAEGVNAIWVSNHGGRQFDAAPASIDVLPQIRAATTLPIIIDSGFETGLDVLRGLALGADFVMFGRGFHHALAALGHLGADHFVDIVKKDIEANLGQMGLSKPAETAKNLV